MASKQLKQGVLKKSMIGRRSEKLLSWITSVSLVFTNVVWFPQNSERRFNGYDK
jgi:hypothetical protein